MEFLSFFVAFRSGTIITDSGHGRNFCGVKEPFAVLILGSYVEVRLRMRGYYTALKAHYFVMNNTDSDGMLTLKPETHNPYQFLLKLKST